MSHPEQQLQSRPGGPRNLSDTQPIAITNVLNRWGQLTYSSFDRSGAGGGWQIKDVSGNLTPQEQDYLRSRISTQFDTRQQVPQFPSPEQIDALPRRLVYVPAADGAAAYWHTVHAGVDGSGRPGNVFAHTLLDRQFSVATPAFRPIELWRSPDLLTPFGAPQVIAAELKTSARPAVGPVTRPAVVKFLLDPEHWARLGVLSALLDAVYRSLNNGPTVVLGTESTDSAALWIAAVSYLMSPEASRRFSFSTLERPRSLAASRLGALNLVAVDVNDLPDLDRSTSLAILSEFEVVELGECGSYPHRTAAGSTINPTSWSALADTVLADPSMAGDLLDRLDQLAFEVGDVGLDPAWPLAMVVALEPEVLAEGLRESAIVLAESSPGSLRSHPFGLRAASDVVRSQIGSDTQSARERVTPRVVGKPRSVIADLVEAIYLERAIQDPAWLTQQGEVWLPAGYLQPPEPDSTLVRLISGELAKLTGQANDRSHDDERSAAGHQLATAVHGLRLADFVLRAGLATDLKVELGELISLLLPTLMDPRLGVRCIEAVGPIQRELGELCIEEVKHGDALSHGLIGGRLDPVLLQWLCPSPRTPWDPGQVVEHRAEVSAFDGEYAVNVVRGNLPTNPDEYPRWRFLVLWSVLSEEQVGLITRFVDKDALFTDLKSSEYPWSVADISRLNQFFPGLVPLRAFANVLQTQPWDTELDALERSLRQDRRMLGGTGFASDQIGSVEDHIVQLSKFRSRAARTWWLESMPSPKKPGGPGISSAVADARTLVQRCTLLLKVPGAPLLAVDVVPSMLTAFAVAVLNQSETTEPGFDPRFLRYLVESSGYPRAVSAIDALVACTTNGVVSMANLCAALILSRDGQPLRWAPGSARDVLVNLTVGDSGLPMLEAVARTRISEFSTSDGERLLGDVGVKLEKFLASVTSAEKNYQRGRSDLEKVFRDWWRDMSGQGSGILGKAKSLFKKEQGPS